MAKNTKTPETKIPSEMLTANLLALLKNWSGYGYELAKKLEEAGYGEYNSGTLYRTLRQMEKNGLISSLWDTSSDGPARRIYSVTSVGSSFLTNWIDMVEMHKNALVSFMDMVAPSGQDSDKDR
ncbi:MAG: helix-turn-helix transcriptional regulator [Immundisolibacteraceae bacterium]|nr:helix-turn-helix transcriptional regulator [Immundisolibacteraceae bacterium]